MKKEALGVIEVVGMATAIEAADSCLKSANVELVGYENTKGSGLIVIKIRGNIGAVKAAIEAAKVSASKVNKVYATLIIPRPSQELEKIIDSNTNKELGSKNTKQIGKEHMKNNATEYISVYNYEGIELKDNKDIENKVEEVLIENKKNNVNGDEKEYVNSDIELTYGEIFDKNSEIQNEFISEEKNDICNICHDSKCKRKKGQPRNLCIHYTKS